MSRVVFGRAGVWDCEAEDWGMHADQIIINEYTAGQGEECRLFCRMSDGSMTQDRCTTEHRRPSTARIKFSLAAISSISLA